MSNVQKMFRILALAVLVGAAVVAQTEAAVITISPVTQDANVGDVVNADILVSGLTATESVGGVSLLLSFDDAILSGLSFIVDPDAAMGTAACGFCDFSFGFTGAAGSPLDLFFISDPALDDAGLKALQGTGFRLATVSFTATANGLSPLSLSTAGIFLSDATGQIEVPASVRGGSVCVGGNCTAPEPGLLTLLGAGLSAIAVRRRRTRRA